MAVIEANAVKKKAESWKEKVDSVGWNESIVD